MKEIQNAKKDDIKIVSEKQIEKQLKHAGQALIRPNQKCYELNLMTNEIVLATIDVKLNPFATGKKLDLLNGVVNGESKFTQNIVTKENCIYVNAINLKNASRKFTQAIQEL